MRLYRFGEDLYKGAVLCTSSPKSAGLKELTIDGDDGKDRLEYYDRHRRTEGGLASLSPLKVLSIEMDQAKSGLI